MKNFARWTVPTILLTVVLAMNVSASRPRKLPASAYIKSAKIEILSGDLERYQLAIAMLDSLFMYYGPYAEGLHLMAAINVDFMEKTADPWAKKQYAEKIVAYLDSLQMCCENKKIKDSYRKDCDEYMVLADSTKVKYWRLFYNAGVEQLNFMTEVSNDLSEITDSASRAFSMNVIQTNIDSCIANMELAIVFNPSNYQFYVAAGSAYEHKEGWQEAIDWFQKGLDAAPDSERVQLLPYIAYDYIRLNNYCGAIPYFSEYVERAPGDLKMMDHLASCYNNCEKFDSAAAVYREMLEIDSANADVMTNLGRYYNQLARTASDSISTYREAGQEAQVKAWRAKQSQAFDSSSVFFRKVFEMKPEDAEAAEEYGLVSAIQGKYKQAADAYSRLTVLEPDNEGHWTYLGDCYLNLKEFDKAAAAYEKVVALNDKNRQIWSRLADLYTELGKKDKATAARKKAE